MAQFVLSLGCPRHLLIQFVLRANWVDNLIFWLSLSSVLRKNLGQLNYDKLPNKLDNRSYYSHTNLPQDWEDDFNYSKGWQVGFFSGTINIICSRRTKRAGWLWTHWPRTSSDFNRVQFSRWPRLNQRFFHELLLPAFPHVTSSRKNYISQNGRSQ